MQGLIGQQNLNNLSRKLLILDLDETIIYADTQSISELDHFRAGDYYVYKRPYLDSFLTFCLDNFEIGIWTASSEAYAAFITSRLFNFPASLSFVWAHSRCTWAYDAEMQERYLIKDLKKVRRKGYDLSQVIAIDDTPQKYKRSYGNLVTVKEFCGEREDEELFHLKKYLECLIPVGDVRKVDKRGWRESINANSWSP